HRQKQRGNSTHLADDLRELSARDADAAFDSLGLIRIIVWAIPMLGFLGTVIGITQTLGGLDFTDGGAAVERLKSGLYVAFDTTALGLVLSVIAIFLQFPVERREQKLLSVIDARVGQLLSTHLPSDDAQDDQTQVIEQLCDGIRLAVSESLSQQTTLWRQTIDEAHQNWNSIYEGTVNKFAEAIGQTMTPALRDHAASLDESARFAGDRLENQASRWQEVLEQSSDALSIHQRLLINRYDQLAEVNAQADTINARAESIQAIQMALDANLERLQEVNAAIEQGVKASAGDGMADAMRILARAVDTLTQHLPVAATTSDSVRRQAA
ncbi:MAG: MotA/TolQ/ExbB proton channel family protein, partial [Planctomycetota bacterium]